MSLGVLSIPNNFRLPVLTGGVRSTQLETVVEAGRGVRKLPAQPVQPGINRFASNAGAVVSLNRMMSEPSGGLAPVSAAGMSMSAGGQTAVRPNVLQGVAGTNGFHGAAAGTQPLPQGTTHQRSYQAFFYWTFFWLWRIVN